MYHIIAEQRAKGVGAPVLWRPHHLGLPTSFPDLQKCVDLHTHTHSTHRQHVRPPNILLASSQMHCQATPWHTRTEMCGEKEEGEGLRHLRSDGLDSDGFRYHTLVARSHTHLLIGLQYGCRHRKHRLKQASPDQPQHGCTKTYK